MYKIKSAENKSIDWKVVTTISPDGYETPNVSVNRKNKNGEVFPNFDGVVEGATIDATVWKSPAGKWYMFAPKTASNGSNFANKGPSSIKAAQERKAEMIEKAQDRKSESIAYFNAVNSAITLRAADRTLLFNSVQDEREYLTVWRNWFLSEWEKYNDLTNEPPF